LLDSVVDSAAQFVDCCHVLAVHLDTSDTVEIHVEAACKIVHQVQSRNKINVKQRVVAAMSMDSDRIIKSVQRVSTVKKTFVLNV